MLNATDTYTPMVTWQFTDEDAAEQAAIERSEEIRKSFQKYKHGRQHGVQLNFAYKLKKKKNVVKAFIQRLFFDDGIRTYIVIPEKTTVTICRFYTMLSMTVN